MLSGYARKEWLTILVIGLMLAITSVVVGWWPLAILLVVLVAALLLFFRDPDRRVPTQRGVMVAPADGRVSSIHDVEHFEPFDGPAVCVRIFLSVLDVHVNRSPAHGVVSRISHKPGRHLNALNPDSAEANESVLMVLEHPVRREPVAAVRQVAGLLARTVVCAAKEGVVLQRGQRFGIIKLGSTTELYVPRQLQPVVQVQQGQYVYGGLTILLSYSLGPALAATEGAAEGAGADSDGRGVAAPAPAATGDPLPEPAADDTATDPANQAGSDPVT